jgi:hypothetical protein
MSFLDRLARRTLGEASGLKVRRRARFEPAGGLAGTATPVFAETVVTGNGATTAEDHGADARTGMQTSRKQERAAAPARAPAAERKAAAQSTAPQRDDPAKNPVRNEPQQAAEPARLAHAPPLPEATQKPDRRPETLSQAARPEPGRTAPERLMPVPPESRATEPRAGSQHAMPEAPVMLPPAVPVSRDVPPAARPDHLPQAAADRPDIPVRKASSPVTPHAAETLPDKRGATAPPLPERARFPERREVLATAPSEVPAFRRDIPPAVAPLPAARVSETPQVEVRIGRMEIRVAVPAPAPARPQKASGLARLPSLADHLARPRGR